MSTTRDYFQASNADLKLWIAGGDQDAAVEFGIRQLPKGEIRQAARKALAAKAAPKSTPKAVKVKKATTPKASERIRLSEAQSATYRASIEASPRKYGTGFGKGNTRMTATQSKNRQELFAKLVNA